MKRLAAAAILMGASLAAVPQKLPWQTASSAGASDNQKVHYLYPQQITAEAGKPTLVEMHFRIDSGLHINSHEPRQKSLIRTELIAAEPTGVKIASVDFPAGSDYAFPADPSQKLSVYSGDFILKMHLTAERGDHLIQAVLRYQACDTNTCFPPRNAPVAMDLIAR